tara:strand:+ start:651 stop:815 length:165 start_codon:yes stop_codon:yes gene_type:complete
MDINAKKPISSRVNAAVYDRMVEVSKDPNHRFHDRKVAYIVNKVLEDWLAQEDN